MRTSDKIRIANAFKRGMTLCGILFNYKCVKSSREIEDAIRWALAERKNYEHCIRGKTENIKSISRKM